MDHSQDSILEEREQADPVGAQDHRPWDLRLMARRKLYQKERVRWHERHLRHRGHRIDHQKAVLEENLVQRNN